MLPTKLRPDVPGKIDPGTDTNDSSVNVIHFNAYNAGVVEDKTFLFHCYVSTCFSNYDNVIYTFIPYIQPMYNDTRNIYLNMPL